MSAEMPAMDGEKLTVGMLLYPGFTLLDMAGPQSALALHGTTHMIWKNMDLVPTDSGVSVSPTMTFADVPDNLDVFFIPGGFGTNDAMADDEVVDFVVRAGSTARYITSVCSGSLLLGMAGLLDGYRAATHWALYDVLDALGVEASHDRVVTDRNRITGGGVTAGIDFGLQLLAKLKGDEAAKITQLAMEYDPEPPFAVGHPRSAGPELTAITRAVLGDVTSPGIKIAKQRRVAELV